MTDDEGKFVFADLDENLQFRLLFVSQQHVPTFSQYVIPEPTGMQVELTKHQLDDLPSERVIQGTVVDALGNPVKNAVVDPEGITIEGRTKYGILDGVDTLAVTNAQGKFRIGLKQSGNLHVLVSSHGFVRQNAKNLAPGESNKIKLEQGTVIQGRVVANGKPLADVGMGLVQQDRSTDNWLGSYEINTDENGFFQFVNISSNEKYYLYGLMSRMKEYGCIGAIEIETGASESVNDLATINLQQGYSLRGRVVFSDASEIPEGMRVMIGRQHAWDTQQAVVGADGEFEFNGLPPEEYTLSARRTGYRMSMKNKSLSPVNPFRLIGFVSDNQSGIEVLLEPGKSHSRNDFDRTQSEPLSDIRTRPIRGVEEGISGEPGAEEKGSKKQDG